jgi:glycerol-3-phosphate dehydrogenase (NAD(P)+)
MDRTKRVAVLGGGSWATALAKLLLNNLPHINWYLRSEETIGYIKQHGHNPNYITDIQFDTRKISFYSSISDAIDQSDILIFPQRIA